jgi:hypothetical protein
MKWAKSELLECQARCYRFPPANERTNEERSACLRGDGDGNGDGER